MGIFPKQRFVNVIAWGDVELNLMGPCPCKSDVDKRSTMKVWGAVLEDVNRGAVYCDIVLQYSTEAILLMLKQFLLFEAGLSA